MGEENIYNRRPSQGEVRQHQPVVILWSGDGHRHLSQVCLSDFSAGKETQVSCVLMKTHRPSNNYTKNKYDMHTSVGNGQLS